MPSGFSFIITATCGILCGSCGKKSKCSEFSETFKEAQMKGSF
jgi:hypothetical protein